MILYFVLLQVSLENEFLRCIFSPVIVPGDNNGTIYIATIFRNETNYDYAWEGEVSPGRGFSSGAFIAEKWGLEMFWGECFKICVYKKELSPGTIITCIAYGQYCVIIVPGDDNIGSINGQYIVLSSPGTIKGLHIATKLILLFYSI